jgi:hypothetical protein
MGKQQKGPQNAVMMVLKPGLNPGTVIAPKCVEQPILSSPAEWAENFRRPVPMAWLRRMIFVPANETQMGLVLALCIFTMSVMSVALVWQAQVIAKQNAVIHMLEARFGG